MDSPKSVPVDVSLLASAGGMADPSNLAAISQIDDDAIEQALQIGDETGALESYFGREQYAELRSLARQAAARGTRGGDRVLILPGIMGSKLGHRAALSLLDDVIWLNPLAIMAGRLDELALGGGRRLDALGVLLFTYLSLKLRMRIAGFDADFHPYDWRRSLSDLGKELAERISDEGRKVRIIAHSMGGLVARASFAHKPAHLERVVMLGTPNFGSYAPVQAFRGRNGTVEKVATLDLTHSSAELARIFATFPGLLEMIPAPKTIGAVNLFDPANWPGQGEKPGAAALAAAQRVQDDLPEACDGVDLLLVAGVNQRTAVDARLDGDEFVYTYSDAGDGTVPLRCCLLPGARTYYVEGEHGGLPGLRAIQRALPSLLTTGKTEALSETPPARRSAGEIEVRESELSQPGARRGVGAALAVAGDKRLLVSDFALAAPPADDMPEVRSAEGGGAPAAEQPDEAFSDTIIYSQGRAFRLEIVLARGSITEVDAHCYVLGLFKSVAPTGAASAIDAAMDGAVTEFVRRRMFSGNVGDVTILPNGRHPIRASHVAFAGLGPIDGFSADRLEIVGENLVRTFVAGRVDDFATVPFGAASGVKTVAAVRSLLRGFVRGLRDADTKRRFRTITICENDPARYEEIREEVADLARRLLFDGIELTVSHVTLPEMVAPPATRALPARTDRVYLIVREGATLVDDEAGPSPLVASVLTSGAQATIVSGRQPGQSDALRTELEQLNSLGSLQKVAQVGGAIAQLALAPEIRELLTVSKDQHLVIVHDAEASRIPWEALPFSADPAGPPGKDGFPALGAGISHRYEAANLSVAKWLERRRLGDKLRLLIVADPMSDLPNAAKEGARLEELVRNNPGLSCRMLFQEQARKFEVEQCLRSGEFDVIHYAGHAFFDPRDPGRSGLVCAGRQILSGEELAMIGNLPSLMFVNACEAARIRTFDRNGRRPQRQDKPARHEMARRSIGFAEALLRGGVANFIGTYWPVGDSAAGECAKILYPLLLQGRSINDALCEARRALYDAGEPDWADYVFYGDPDFTLKEG